jgi:hypothetical protein
LEKTEWYPVFFKEFLEIYVVTESGGLAGYAGLDPVGRETLRLEFGMEVFV